jgi:hypothetical protein
MDGVWQAVAESWRHHVIDEGRLPAAALLAGFVVAFIVVRTITHLIRAGRGPFRDVSIGGTHVHHLVYGIFLMLGAGFVGFAVDPAIPGWILPVAFGVGAALTLDEFALWLRLEDVYWAAEGRASVDAVLIALGVAALGVVGAPFAQAVYLKVTTLAALTLGAAQAATLVLAVVVWLKGKRLTAAVTLLVPVVGLVGAIRLARPGSRWARRWYDAARLERALARAAAAGAIRASGRRPAPGVRPGALAGEPGPGAGS